MCLGKVVACTFQDRFTCVYTIIYIYIFNVCHSSLGTLGALGAFGSQEPQENSTLMTFGSQELEKTRHFWLRGPLARESSVLKNLRKTRHFWLRGVFGSPRTLRKLDISDFRLSRTSRKLDTSDFRLKNVRKTRHFWLRGPLARENSEP